VKVGVYHPPIHPRHFGGSVAVTVPIVNELVERGYEVVLFVSDEINQVKMKERMGAEVSNRATAILKRSMLKPRGLMDLYQSGYYLLALKMKCDLIIDTYSDYIFPWCDVSYVHYPYINNDTFKQNFPYLRKRRGIENAFNMPYVLFAKGFKQRSRLILANSRFTSRAIMESLGLKSQVLYPPISQRFFEKDESDSDLNAEREDLVITIGRVHKGKGLETIPQIASMVRNKNVKFLIIGFAHSESAVEGINREIRKFGVSENVILKLDVSQGEMKSLLRKAKVYLHPPILEHFGISIAEAMASGCIPVVYDNGGAKEFVPDEFRYSGLSDAAEKTASAIDNWNPSKAKLMDSIAEQFSETNYRKNFMRIFSAYLEQRQ
jgi:glycosyltransferase involved in cell wall biosynthesis